MHFGFVFCPEQFASACINFKVKITVFLKTLAILQCTVCAVELILAYGLTLSGGFCPHTQSDLWSELEPVCLRQGRQYA